ncbi:Mu transposase C-terminal domain-containing protein [Actinomadura opuntiae]|uniref:Mu transposase C-terminal domain-containing protein n=1 Tax=Actinomadura sp. OS1-43 TaxID=604315 RepID=UPI00255AE214|nr:Mu transposase C-terminal domain-containing protein [Actinomadura sp. OS1-43]MDL4813148.1 Mu transposase C-terminal domain-containing protein [Actinomadura sp. OS1-43]
MNPERAKVQIAYGDWVEFEDERHKVIGLTGPCVRLQSETGHGQIVGLAELIADPSYGAAAAPADAEEGIRLEPSAVLEGLPDDVKKRVLELEAHLLEATTGYRSGDPAHPAEGEPRADYHPGRSQNERVEAKAAELGLTGRRVWQLLDSWHTQGLWGLVDKRKTRARNPLAGIDPRIIQAIGDQYGAEREDSSATVGGRFRRRVQNRLDFEHGQGKVTLPPERTFYRIVRLLLNRSPSGPATTRRTQTQPPDREPGRTDAARPGEIVMMDTTPLDVLAYDPDTDDFVKVEVTVALDVATRSVLAWTFTAEGTKGIDIGMLLADVLVPTPMRPGWDDALRFAAMSIPVQRIIEADQRLADAAALPVIYPETIVIDHGKPYQSDVMKRACRTLGISIQDARILTATDKAKVERVFGTIRTHFSEHVAGYKGYDVVHRGVGIEKLARWTITELGEFFTEYVVSIYQRRHHKGLIPPGFPDERLSPNDAYALAVARTGYVTCPTDPALYFELLPIEGRLIRPDGVQIDYLHYWGDVLRRYRGARSPYPGGKWPIRIDPRNLLHAYFHDPADGTWHLLRWTHALDEHQPFTDITLREVKRLLGVRDLAARDQEHVAAALIELQNRMDAPESWTRTDRKRMARDAERARAAARDRQQAVPAVGAPHEPHPAAVDALHQMTAHSPVLRPVPDPPSDTADTTDLSGFDLSDLDGCEVWDPNEPPSPEL